jgi:hypothetical protein
MTTRTGKGGLEVDHRCWPRQVSVIPRTMQITTGTKEAYPRKRITLNKARMDLQWRRKP